MVRVGISCGDLNGIGPEVVFKAVGSNSLEMLNINIYMPTACYSEERSAIPSNCTMVDLGAVEHEPVLGTSTHESAQWAIRSLQRASSDLIDGKLDVLVTAPIDKHAVSEVGFEFPGHTEYLAQLAGNLPHLMLLMNGNLRMGTITGHIPIGQVNAVLTPELVSEKIKVMVATLRTDLGISRPKVAVLGLNPHAGDQGRIGTEEIDFLNQVVTDSNNENVQVDGPFAADGFFGSRQYEEYDGILSMYHDQGLIPFKTLSFGKGVNYTAGLPFIRTSPDHGTAFNIAGKGLADEGSMLQAINLGVKLYQNRKGLV